MTSQIGHKYIESALTRTRPLQVPQAFSAVRSGGAQRGRQRAWALLNGKA